MIIVVVLVVNDFPYLDIVVAVVYVVCCCCGFITKKLGVDDNKEVVEVPVVPPVIVPAVPPVPSKAEKSDMSDICDSLLVVIQALLLLLFRLLVLLLFRLLLVLLLVLSNPNCVPTPDPRKIKDGRNSRIACDVGDLKGI